MSSVALNFKVKLATSIETFDTYKKIVVICDQMIRTGTEGTFHVWIVYQLGIF